jgi:two-component system, chemotaxis family, response regulator WspF
VRIAIVNDLMMAVEAMRRVLAGHSDHQLAWVARDGREAVECCARDTPDLVLMDLIMPNLDGVEATRQIMAKNPCAIVVVTASVNDHSAKVFEAMGAGALDAVNTPILAGACPSGAETSGADALSRKIETISRLLGAGSLKRTVVAPPVVFHPPPQPDPLVAIGASAGGPAALARILAPLPPNFPAAIIVIQHVDEQFAPGLADWLGYQTQLSVRLAQDDDRPKPGTVLMAGQDSHLVFVSPTRLGYVRQPLDCSYRPSVDVFFKSVARFWPGGAVGVLLTGMGRDGAEGLKLLHSMGHRTIVQNQASSAVYGMPKAAAELHAASEILPLDRIGSRLATLMLRKKTNLKSYCHASPHPLATDPHTATT